MSQALDNIFSHLYILFGCCLILDNNRFLLDVILGLPRLSVPVVVCPGPIVAVHDVLRVPGDLHLVQTTREPSGTVCLVVLALGHLFGLLVLVLLCRHLVQQMLLQLEAVHAVFFGDIHQGFIRVESPELVALKYQLC